MAITHFLSHPGVGSLPYEGGWNIIAPFNGWKIINLTTVLVEKRRACTEWIQKVILFSPGESTCSLGTQWGLDEVLVEFSLRLSFPLILCRFKSH